MADLMKPAERGLVLRVAVVLAIPLAFVVLIPSLFGFWLVDREAAIRSKENRALIVQIREAETASQDLLVRFVCTSVKIRRVSQEFADHALVEEFTRLLRTIQRDCA